MPADESPAAAERLAGLVADLVTLRGLATAARADGTIGTPLASAPTDAVQLVAALAAGPDGVILAGAPGFGAALGRGVPVADLLAGVRAGAIPGTDGLQAVGLHDDAERGLESRSDVPGVHLAHALGLAWGRALRGTTGAVVVTCDARDLQSAHVAPLLMVAADEGAAIVLCAHADTDRLEGELGWLAPVAASVGANVRTVEPAPDAATLLDALLGAVVETTSTRVPAVVITARPDATDASAVDERDAGDRDPQGSTADRATTDRPDGSVLAEATGPEPGEPLGGAIARTLRSAMARDERIVLLGRTARRGGAFRATAGLAATFGPARVLDAPLAADDLLGVAVGMARAGLRPVVEVPSADAAHGMLGQLVEVASWSARTGGRATLPLVIRAPWGGSVRGGPWHSQSPLGWSSIPGLTVTVPATPDDGRTLLADALALDGPAVLLEHSRLQAGGITVAADRAPARIGPARLLREGADVLLVTWGLHGTVCVRAADQLAEEGIGVEVLDLVTLRPLDRATLHERAAARGRVLVVHEDARPGGPGAEVAALLAEHTFFALDTPIVTIAPEGPFGLVPAAADAELASTVSVTRVVEAVRRLARL